MAGCKFFHLATSYMSDTTGTNMEKEFLAAYEQYQEAIFKHCYFRVFERELAKELAQETFMRAWQYLADGKTVENLRAFLYRIANNLVIDVSRKKKEASLETMQENGFEPATQVSLDAISDQLDLSKVRKLISELEPMYRDVLIMRYLDGLPPKEIAQAIGETTNVVSVRIHRGVEQLKKLLKNYVV